MRDLNDYSDISQHIRYKCEQIIIWLVDERVTLRRCSDEVMMPASTVRLYVHTYIKNYYPEDYQQIKAQFRRNLKRFRNSRSYKLY